MQQKNSASVSISRRRLLRAMGAVPLSTSLYGLTAGTASAIQSIGANPVLLNKYAGQQVYTPCLRNCPDRCTLRFTVQNGRMTYVTGDEKETRKTAGTPCVKGLAYVEYTYAPDRILHPMRRVGPKGSGKFVRITWDEAYAEIAAKWKDIIAKYGSEAIVPYSYSGNYADIGMYSSAERLWNYLGATHLDRTWCVNAGVTATIATFGTLEDPDFENVATSDLYISWGFNELASSPHTYKLVNEMRRKGGKVIGVNVERTPMCSQADMFIQPYPGTDNWLAMGLIKYFIEHDYVDHEYIETQTIGYADLVKQVESVTWDQIVNTTRVPLRGTFQRTS